MNLGSIRKTMMRTAKEKLARHKDLGKRSPLSVIQVAELLDLLHGNTELSNAHSGIFFENSFSLN